jgi:hypothetical protein
MEKAYTAAIRAIAAVGLAIAIYLAASAPIGIAEAALWDHLIRPPLREAYRAPNAWNGFLYSILAERAIGLFRLSTLSLRLPSILACGFCAWVLWRGLRPLIAVVYVVALAAGWFSSAQGIGVAVAFWSLGVHRPRHAGWLFGLALAASPFVAPLGLMYWRIRDIERVVIPAVVTAFIFLIVPSSAARRVEGPDSRPDFYREMNRRNAARGGGFQPPAVAPK